MARDRFLKQSLGSLHTHIQQSKILVVGAGGIGCELLKNLVCSGFKNVHIVDLDTIDLSNLNRQFLFRQAHIKKSKALVAKESAGKFNPEATIQAYHANIKDAQFNVGWFKSFDIVFNALDNLDARRHANRMCVAAEVPLIESGTTGFNGQVQPIKPGKTACYDCTPKATPKSYPVCTIRSTPSQPIHCIVWAKSYLFNELFGISEDESADLDHTEDAENKEEIEKLRKEAAALKKIRQSIGGHDFQRMVFDKVYNEDIKRLLSMEDMWKTRKPPTPLKYEDHLSKAIAVTPSILLQDQKAWSLEENISVFNSSLMKLSLRMEELRSRPQDGSAPILTFDKDDKDTLEFVAAAANLRSIVFGIETKSEFDIKQMAGNIIPAIATTNANTAALCVLQAYRVIQGRLDKAKMVFLTKSVDRATVKEPLQPPNPDCAVCGNVRAVLTVDSRRAVLSDLVENVLKGKLGYTDELSVGTDAGIVYDPDLEDNLPRKLVDLKISEGAFVTIVDGEDEPRVNLQLVISEKEMPDGDAAIMLAPDVLEIPKKPKSVSTNGTTPTESAPPAGQKRKRGADDEEVVMTKRGKTGNVNGAITIDEDDGAIVLE